MNAQRDVTIPRASETDLPALGTLGALLMRVHFAYDAQRFMHPGNRAEDAYESFLRAQLDGPDAIVLVADRSGDVVGYVYAAIEPQSWKELRERAGFIHDIVVDEASRGSGVAGALLTAAMDWLRTRGVPRVILSTAVDNERAQRLFATLGFRRTMIEMTRELA